ncbi:MAG: 4Fe-4S binding protein [Deltaproteobacteria bacterium]|jgi:NADH-quinone oxidoreductase subunit I|nr:4Fe-4S binding protein [Deltaproteobacteria bacterium]
MIKAIIDNLKGLYSLLVGLSITGRFFVSPQKTTHYPRQVDDPECLKSYRGPLELVPADDTGQSKCISCQMCVRACPGHCLTVTKGDKGKAPKVYLYDFTLCCLCAACVESCPTGAIRFSHKVYLVAPSREALHLDLLADLLARAPNPPQPKAEAEAEGEGNQVLAAPVTGEAPA